MSDLIIYDQIHNNYSFRLSVNKKLMEALFDEADKLGVSVYVVVRNILKEQLL